MNKVTSSLILVVLAVLSVSFINAEKAVPSVPAIVIKDSSASFNKVHELAASVPGLSEEVIDYALKGYNKLVAEGAVTNMRYLTIVDMSKSSREKRFYLIDVENDSLVMNTYVAHGKNTGLDKAESFSNLMNSEQSSLGFYVTQSTYNGKHGLSLRLRGMEKGFNDNAEQRGIVVHAADYVNEGRAHSAYMGRSQGCPALPNAEAAEAISYMKDGSTLFVYNPDKNYIAGSALLN